jgi:hypothetical protein
MSHQTRMDTGIGLTVDSYHDCVAHDEEPCDDNRDNLAQGLWDAARECDIEDVQSEIGKDGINVDQRCVHINSTALFELLSTYRGFSQIQDTTAIAYMLIRRGADPIAQCRVDRSTPLHVVVQRYEYINILRMMITQHPNLNLNVQDIKGQTPILRHVMMHEEGAPDDIIQTLLEHGADPRIPNINGNNVMYYVRQRYCVR